MEFTRSRERRAISRFWKKQFLELDFLLCLQYRPSNEDLVQASVLCKLWTSIPQKSMTRANEYPHQYLNMKHQRKGALIFILAERFVEFITITSFY